MVVEGQDYGKNTKPTGHCSNCDRGNEDHHDPLQSELTDDSSIPTDERNIHPSLPAYSNGSHLSEKPFYPPYISTTPWIHQDWNLEAPHPHMQTPTPPNSTVSPLDTLNPSSSSTTNNPPSPRE